MFLVTAHLVALAPIVRSMCTGLREENDEVLVKLIAARRFPSRIDGVVGALRVLDPPLADGLNELLLFHVKVATHEDVRATAVVLLPKKC